MHRFCPSRATGTGTISATSFLSSAAAQPMEISDIEPKNHEISSSSHLQPKAAGIYSHPEHQRGARRKTSLERRRHVGKSHRNKAMRAQGQHRGQGDAARQ